MPPVSKIWRTMSSAWSNPRYLKIDRTVPSFSVEKRCSFPIRISSTIRNVLSLGIAKPARRRDDRCGTRDRVRRAMAFRVPVGGLEQILLGGVHQISAFNLQLLQELIVNRRVDKQVAIGRTPEP